MTIGKVAKSAGVNPATVRYYERRGLLPPPRRRPSGYRDYDAEHVRRIRFIKRAQELGFTLREIHELMALRHDPGADCGDVRRRAAGKLADLDGRLRDLEAMRRVLADLVAACAGTGTTDACPILSALATTDREK